jgi:hypothetical protein
MAVSSRLRRVQRSAQSVAGGEAILSFLQGGINKRRLVDAAAKGLPPVTSISTPLQLLAKAKSIDLEAMSVRQFVGAAVRAILEDEGYTVAEKGVRTPKDPVFRSGSVYRKKAPLRANDTDLIARLIATLNDQEAQHALNLLQARWHKS